VAKSKVGYRGPLPTNDEYTDATIIALEEKLRGGKHDDNDLPDPTLPPVPFELKHVPQALTELTKASGMDPARLNPFLSSKGIGLLSTGRPTEKTANLEFAVGEDASPKLKLNALEHDPNKSIGKGELKSLCMEYMGTPAP